MTYHQYLNFTVFRINEIEGQLIDKASQLINNGYVEKDINEIQKLNDEIYVMIADNKKLSKLISLKIINPADEMASHN